MPLRKSAFPIALVTLFLLPLAGDRSQALLGLRSLGGLVGHANAAVEPSKDKNYDLTSLELFRRSVVQVKDNYVEPNRINPKEMFIAALEAVEKQVPEVMVEPGLPPCEEAKAGREPGVSAPAPKRCGSGKVAEGKVRVTVDASTKDFDYGEIANVWQIPLKMRDVFAFVKEHIVSQGDQREIEYAAVNGMLSTLDPHSWLLKPDLYKEMKVQTRGEFGGLGFVISMREDKLTVMRVLKNTPAQRAGIKKGDVITQIDSDSTVSMDVGEAVDKMRGKPSTKVTIHVSHKGSEPKKLELTRATITYETVTSRLLDKGVGYVRLGGFSGTTTREMQAAIKAMKQQAGGALKGLVLDMRGNPGGLLEQAIQVSDVFVEDGTIVTTVGMNGQLREPKLAHNDGGEREFPMAVLISGDSASASEIVAGALKNLNRAIIVGRQSFGKGSVQLLYDMPDTDAGDSALKLTIAQYLTPGDISIQEVGITPDIELVPARVVKSHVDVFAPPKTFREADYEKHFFNAFAQSEEAAKAARAQAAGKPLETLRFLREESAKEKKAREAVEAGQQQEEEAIEEDPSDDEVAIDYQMEFCRDLLLKATSTNRVEQLKQARPFVAEKRAAEQEKVKRALEALGLDWRQGPQAAGSAAAGDGQGKESAGKPGQKVKLQSELRAPRTVAGQTLDLVLTAQNQSSEPVYRLRAITKSDNPLFDRREFVIGKLEPGEKRSWSVPVKVPRFTPSRRDTVAASWEDDGASTFDPVRVETDLAELPRPMLGWSYHLQGGSADGLLHKGEPVDLVLDIKNLGPGQAYDAYAGIKNLADDRINVKKARAKLGPMKPGEVRQVTFVIEAKRPLDGDAPVPVRLELGDRELGDSQREKVYLPVGPPVAQTATGPAVKLGKDATLLAAAREHAAPLASAKKGTVLPSRGRFGNFVKVEWQKGATAFLPADALAPDAPKSARGQSKATLVLQKEPPSVRLTNLDTSHGGIETESDRLLVSGVASDPSGLRDLQIFVQHETEYRKVFFRTARKDGDAATVASAPSLDFSTELNLRPGNSTVYFIAREDDDLQTVRTLIVHRRTEPALAAAKKGGAKGPVAEAPIH